MGSVSHPLYIIVSLTVKKKGVRFTAFTHSLGIHYERQMTLSPSIYAPRLFLFYGQVLSYKEGIHLIAAVT